MNAYAKVGAFLVLGTLLSSEAFAESKYSEWGPPVNLGCGGINSPSDDLGPGISKDGLSFYFASNRPAPGASGGLDIYIAQRPSGDAPWSARLRVWNSLTVPRLGGVPADPSLLPGFPTEFSPYFGPGQGGAYVTLGAREPSCAARVDTPAEARKVYRSSFIPGLHDVCMVFEKPQ